MVVERIDKAWWHKLNSVTRFALTHSFGLSRMPLVNEFPKSGGTWFEQMLSECSGLPFPRNRLPMLNRCILHGHYRAHPGMKNVILLWRDGRDIMVSMYYYRMLQPRHKSSRHTEHIIKATGISDPENVKENLPRFIEYCMTTPSYPRFTWPEFVADWVDREDVLHLSYERLLTDASGSLEEALDFIGLPRPTNDRIAEVVRQNSFAAKTRRKPGVEDKQSFLRKGIAGDWRNKFSDEAIEVFDHYAGDALARLGYAPSRPNENLKSDL